MSKRSAFSCNLPLATCDYSAVSLSYPLQRHPNMHAAVLTEAFAALVLFQRHWSSKPPYKNLNSAVFLVLPACHFSGSMAQIATNEVEEICKQKTLDG